MEMALAAAAGKPLPDPAAVATALMRGAKECPETDPLLKGGSTVRLALVVRGGALHAPKKAPTEAVALCLVHAMDGARLTANNTPDEYEAIAEIRAAQR